MAKPDAKIILIADDEARMRRFMQMNLELEGYRVIEASNGLEAIDRVREWLFRRVRHARRGRSGTGSAAAGPQGLGGGGSGKVAAAGCARARNELRAVRNE